MYFKFFADKAYKPPKIKENSETGYTFSTKIPKPLEGEGILGARPRQLLVKYLPGVTGKHFLPKRKGNLFLKSEVKCVHSIVAKLRHKNAFNSIQLQLTGTLKGPKQFVRIRESLNN